MNKHCIIVLGMHRSGTSALAGSLVRSGFDCGYSLLPKGKENPKGFYENVNVLKFNKQILKSAGKDWADIHTSVIPEISSLDFEIDIKRFLEEEFSRPSTILLKDPRFCQTLLCWLPILEKEYKIHCIISFRNPFDVANSLYKRNLIDLNQSYLLYCRYLLNAIIVTYHQHVQVVDYSNIIKNRSSEIESIFRNFNIDVDLDSSEKNEIDSFLTHKLNHSDPPFEGDNNKYLDFANEVYQFLQTFSQNGPMGGMTNIEEVYDAVKEFHDRLNGLCKLYISELVQNERIDGTNLVLEQRIFELETENQNLRTKWKKKKRNYKLHVKQQESELIHLQGEYEKIRNINVVKNNQLEHYRNSLEEVKRREDETKILLPQVSIVVICWNNSVFLKDCFDSLRNQTYKNIEVFLVDNDSEDESVDFTREYYPEVRILELNKNIGFAAGNNRAIELILAERKSKYIFILNPDTTLEDNCIQELVVHASEYYTFGSFSPKMLMMECPDRLNSAGGDCLFKCGDNLARSFFFKDSEDPSREVNVVRDIFGPSGAGTFIRSDLLRQIGGFEEELFTYYEDVELNLRVMLSGWRSLYVPSARMHHFQGGTLDDFSSYKTFLINRNKFIVLIRTLPWNVLCSFSKDILLGAIALIKHLLANNQRAIATKILFYFLYSWPYHFYKRWKLLKRFTPSKDTVKYIKGLIEEHEEYMTPGVRAESFRAYNEYMSQRISK